MEGIHLLGEWYDCPPGRACMSDAEALRTVCLEAVEAAGLECVRDVFHRFAPAPGAAAPPGITGVVLLAESHLAVHTWPELGTATLDIYVCNFGRDNSAKARDLLGRLMAAFAPARVERRTLERGAAAVPAA